MSTRLKLVLLFVILVIPLLLVPTTARVAFRRAETLEFCSSCHTMDPWVENVTSPDSDSLAAEHFKNRWIQHDQCYTCHTNYGFLGPLKAKINGVRHVIAFYVGGHGKIELFDEFPNANCLQCHAEAKTFREEPSHDPIEDILAGKDRCVECHDPVHGVDQSASDEGADADGDGKVEREAATETGDAKDAAGAEKPGTGAKPEGE